MIAALGCRRDSSTIAPDPSARPKKDLAPIDDEGLVWSTVIDDMAAPFADAGAPMQISNETVPVHCVADVSPTSMPTAKQETIDAWSKQKPGQRLHAVSTRAPVTLVAPAGGQEINFPGSLYVSGVGFDGARDDAIVLIAHATAHAESLRGVVYHLVRNGDAWRKMELVRCLW